MKTLLAIFKYITIPIVVIVSSSLILSYISDLKTENKSLKQQLVKYTNKEVMLSKYTFNPRVGVYENKTDGFSYCPKCLLENELEAPLKSYPQYFLCPVCDNEYFIPKPHPSP